jgi:hypothetical protein
MINSLRIERKTGWTRVRADRRRAQPVIRETRRIVRSNSGIVIDLSFEVDANRRELSRSPGSRFFGWKLPSQRWLRQWLTRFAPPRLQWRGRSGLAPDSHTKPSRTIYTASSGRESSFPDASLGGITERRSARSTADRAGFFLFRRAPEISRPSSQS